MRRSHREGLFSSLSEKHGRHPYWNFCCWTEVGDSIQQAPPLQISPGSALLPNDLPVLSHPGPAFHEHVLWEDADLTGQHSTFKIPTLFQALFLGTILFQPYHKYIIIMCYSNSAYEITECQRDCESAKVIKIIPKTLPQVFQILHPCLFQSSLKSTEGRDHIQTYTTGQCCKCVQMIVTISLGHLQSRYQGRIKHARKVL